MDRTQWKNGKESERSAAHEIWGAGLAFCHTAIGGRIGANPRIRLRCATGGRARREKKKRSRRRRRWTKKKKKKQKKQKKQKKKKKMGRTARYIDAPRCAVGREERRVEGPRRWADEDYEEEDEREEKESPSMAPGGDGRAATGRQGIGSGGGASATFEVLLRSLGSPTCCGPSTLLAVVVERFDVSARR